MRQGVGPLELRWRRLLDAAPQATAIDTPEGVWSRQAFEQLIHEQAQTLSDPAWGDCRVRPWMGWNAPALLAALLACERTGLVFSPLNWRLADEELIAQLRDAGASRVLGEGDWSGRARALTERLAAEAKGSLGASPAPADAFRGGDLMLVYTSGTTGIPHGAVHTATGMSANADAAIAVQGLGMHDCVLSVLPMFHVGGLCIQTLPALLAGARIRLHARFDAQAWLDDVAQSRPTTSRLVPATIRALLDHPGWPQADLSSLRFVNTGSSIVPIPLIEAFHARGVPVAQVYGSTETGPVSIALRPEEARQHPGRVGRPAPGISIRLVSPTSLLDVASGEVGEVWVRGLNMMRGYLRRSGDNGADTGLVDGWFRSGDLARQDAFGLYEIVGRSKDMIISGGENIYPAEIENLVEAMDGVAQCAVVGLPDPRWGEVPVLAVVPQVHATLDPAALASALQGRLARYKQPRRIVVMDDLPRTALGKVRKADLASALAGS